MKHSLILVPGLLCDGTVWTHQAAVLGATADVRIAENAGVDSLGSMADAIIATAPPRFALAGHSMGGRVALEVVRRIPHRILGLALLDTGYQALSAGEVGEKEADGRFRMVRKAREHGMKSMGIAWVQGMVLPAQLSDSVLVGEILAMIERRDPDYYEAQTRALLDRPDAAAVLEAIDFPTLVMCGRQDAWATLGRHREMAARIAGSRLAIIEDCGHMCTMERPEAVTRELLTWFEAVASSTSLTD